MAGAGSVTARLENQPGLSLRSYPNWAAAGDSTGVRPPPSVDPLVRAGRSSRTLPGLVQAVSLSPDSGAVPDGVYHPFGDEAVQGPIESPLTAPGRWLLETTVAFQPCRSIPGTGLPGAQAGGLYGYRRNDYALAA